MEIVLLRQHKNLFLLKNFYKVKMALSSVGEKLSYWRYWYQEDKNEAG